MKLDVAGDLLSELPECIIESILIRMPIQVAIKTCLLSSKWRYKWNKIPILVFEDDMIFLWEKEHSCHCMSWCQHFSRFITHTLFLHEGPIHRFEVLVAGTNLSCLDIHLWILYLSRNTEVKELILAMSTGNYWRAPSCLFKCENLTYLELHYCNLHPLSDFQVFSVLKTLILKGIDGPPEPIEFLISHCPLLETLSMSSICRCKLHIDVPRLTCLTLEGKLEDIILVNTPLLLSADITMCPLFDEDPIEHQDPINQSIFHKFLGAVPLLEKLVGNVFFAKYLSIGNEFAPFPITCNNLAVMELHCIDFEDIELMNVVVRLLVSSPILHTLTISVGQVVELESESDVELILAMSSGSCWRAPSCLFKCENLTYLELHNCNLRPPSDFQGFSVLKTLTLKGIDGPPEPIEFLISHCPLLETLSMSFICRCKLHIDAPRLKCLTLEGKLEVIILVNTPLLLSADITMCPLFDEDAIEHRDLINQSIFHKFLGAVPLLEKLVGNVFFAKYLSIGNEFAPFPITCNNIAVVELHCIRFEDIELMNVVVRLLVSSPILHTLTISVCQEVEPKSESESEADVSWDTDSLPNSNLEHLQQVKLIEMCGHLNEFIFVEILLRQSPVLKTLEISNSTALSSAQRDKVVIKLLGFQRASPLAKIVVLQSLDE